jgi:hypothetical protein
MTRACSVGGRLGMPLRGGGLRDERAEKKRLVDTAYH